MLIILKKQNFPLTDRSIIMEFRYTKEEEEFRQEVRQFLQSESELIEKVKQEEISGAGWGPYTWEFMRKAGAKGYLTPSWPQKYGGLGASHMERYIVSEELAYCLGRLAAVGVGMAGPVILHSGTEEQKEEFLPRIARGEIEFSLGYTEPEAGSDLASLEIRAVRDGDYYKINGQKVFNTASHYSQYHWLAARTDPAAKKHRGISMFIVDLKSPGITIRPLTGLGKIRTNEVFYDDVKVPADRLVGEENRGWEYLIAALAFERTWHAGENIYELETLLDYIRNTKRNGKPIADDPTVRQDVAQLAIDIEVARLFGLRIACIIEKGAIPTYESSMTKMFGSETAYNLAAEWMKIIAPYGQLNMGSKHAIDDGRPGRVLYNRATRSLITAGTSEIQRNIIAMQLGLPRG